MLLLHIKLPLNKMQEQLLKMSTLGIQKVHGFLGYSGFICPKNLLPFVGRSSDQT